MNNQVVLIYRIVVFISCSPLQVRYPRRFDGVLHSCFFINRFYRKCSLQNGQSRLIIDCTLWLEEERPNNRRSARISGKDLHVKVSLLLCTVTKPENRHKAEEADGSGQHLITIKMRRA